MTVARPPIDEVRKLQRRLQEWLQLTPVLRCRALEQRLGGDVTARQLDIVEGHVHATPGKLERHRSTHSRGPARNDRRQASHLTRFDLGSLWLLCQTRPGAPAPLRAEFDWLGWLEDGSPAVWRGFERML